MPSEILYSTGIIEGSPGGRGESRMHSFRTHHAIRA